MIMVLLAGALGACGGGKVSLSTADGFKADTFDKEGQGGDSGTAGAARRSRCDTSSPDRETSEYDTSGDGKPDVFKVFRRLGTEPLYRLVMSCREADLNGDGIRDVVRFYDDEGRPLREEADRNFDGKPEEFTIYQNGEIMQREVDTNGDGVVDLKIYYDGGEPVRSERDLSGRSTADKWIPNRWEYYEGSRVIRMGTDLDGDGRVDRWDRNESLKSSAAKEEPAEEGAEGAEGAENGEAESESNSESSGGG
jgi:hypothetical protein